MSSASRAISAPKPKTYLLGYVAGIIYHDGSEWLLTKTGDYADTFPGAKKENSSHAWPTVEEAIKVAREHPSSYPAFVRPYLYYTANPKNAKGLKEWEDGKPRTMISDLPSP